jgi:3',5'-cyclic AMP phosphodiesterase CpdA
MKIHMKKNNFTRRAFLKSAVLGAAALSVDPVASIAGKVSERKTFTFVQICDTQLGFGGYEHDVIFFKEAVKQVNALNPDFVLICGDLVDKADDKSFADFSKIKAEFTVPCHCVSGNHDIGNKPTRDSLKYYREVIGKDYYTFEHKGYTFVIVNTQLWKAPLEGESDKHDSWLKATLQTAAKKDSRIFVVGHYPLFLKEADEKEEYMNLPVTKRKELLSLFVERGVIAVLGGHTHRLILNDFMGIQFVNGETTSKNLDNRPFGFRLWHVGDTRPLKHKLIPLVMKNRVIK